MRIMDLLDDGGIGFNRAMDGLYGDDGLEMWWNGSTLLCKVCKYGSSILINDCTYHLCMPWMVHECFHGERRGSFS